MRFFPAVLILLALSLPAQERSTLIVAFGNDWVPYYAREADGSWSGLEIDLVGAIFREAGISIKAIPLPTPRAQDYLKTGEIDFLTSASFTDGRNGYARFSEAYRDETVAIMIRAADGGRYPMARLRDIGNYPGTTLAFQRGAWYGPQFQEVLSDPALADRLVDTLGLDTRLKMLAAGRVTMVIGDYYALVAAAKAQGLSDRLAVHPLTVSEEPIHLMFSRESVSAKTVGKIDAAIGRLKKNGTLEAILNRWKR